MTQSSQFHDNISSHQRFSFFSGSVADVNWVYLEEETKLMVNNCEAFY